MRGVRTKRKKRKTYNLRIEPDREAKVIIITIGLRWDGLVVLIKSWLALWLLLTAL